MTTVNIKSDSAPSPDYKHSFLTNDFFSLEIGQTWVRLIMQKRIILCSEDLVIDANRSRGPRVNRNNLYQIMHRKVGCWGRLGDGFVTRNWKSMWAIKQNHMYIVNRGTCSITVYFIAETSIQPLGGNAIKHFS